LGFQIFKRESLPGERRTRPTRVPPQNRAADGLNCQSY
jgi:hypothetical protein